MVNIRALIPSKTRLELLKLLALNPGNTFHVNELSRRTGFSLRGVAKELENLLSGGILSREVTGNQHRYQLDPDCPIHNEIKGLVLKTVGLCDLVKRVLGPVEKDIELALIFGSFASGDYDNTSDVDLFVVSDLSGVKLSELLGPVQNEIGRAINVSQFRRSEYRRRKTQKDHFLTRVLEGPTITVFGHLDDA
ncbi:MAG: nucleotidyltransferase domain-containing protein [Thermodesulfobacteriota bacterium]|nr:nucleotidyltransferase domain-containing protein [Thermodesulfobacteriota bacterium]